MIWKEYAWNPGRRRQQAYTKTFNTEAYDWFGFSVALHGGTLVVGARWEDSAATGSGGEQDDDSAVDSGAIYMFH